MANNRDYMDYTDTIYLSFKESESASLKHHHGETCQKYGQFFDTHVFQSQWHKRSRYDETSCFE